MKHQAFLTATVAACLLGSVGSVALADTVYRWVDAQGHVHYSQTPPQNINTKAKAVDIQPPPPDQTSLDQTKDMEQAVHSQREAQQALAGAAAKKAEAKAQQQKACEAARSRVKHYNEARRVIQRDKNGKEVYSSGDDLVKLRQQAEEQANKLCSEAGGGT